MDLIFYTDITVQAPEALTSFLIIGPAKQIYRAERHFLKRT